MLTQVEGKMVANRKEGDIWNGQTVYYSDSVDHYEWVLADFVTKKADYIVFSKKSMHKMIEDSFGKFYDALKRGCNTVYRGMNADCIKTYIDELPIILYTSSKKRLGLTPFVDGIEIQELSFECVHRAYDLDYTLMLGGHKIESSISDWSTSLRLLRYQLIVGNNIELYFEDSPTVISFPLRTLGYNKDVDLVGIVPDTFVGGLVLYGYCMTDQVVKAVYEGFTKNGKVRVQRPGV